jgi:phytoene dehydrogenase-like protein
VHTPRRRLQAEEVVATCSPHAVASMIDDVALGPHFRRQLDRLELGLGNFTVYGVLDAPPEDYGLTRSEFIVAEEPDRVLDADEVHSDARYQHWPLSVTNYHLLDPDGGAIVELTILDHPGRWFELDKDAYKREKARVQELIVGRALRAFPRLAGHFKYLESSTPRTNYRYTRSPGGSAFGYKAVPGRNVRFLRNCRVKGLKFVGTWVVGAGYEPAMCLGFTEAHLKPAKAANAAQLAVNERGAMT